MGERRQIEFEHVVVIVILEGPNDSGVTARDDLDDFLRLFLVQFFLEVFVTKPFFPQRFRLIQIFGAGQGFAVHDELIVRIEFEFLSLEEFGDVIDLLLEPFQKAQKDNAPRTRISLFEGEFVEGMPVAVKFLEIGLDEIEMEIVQGVEITVEEFGGNLVVKGLSQIVSTLQNGGSDPGNAGLVWPRCQVHQIGVFPGDKCLIRRGNGSRQAESHAPANEEGKKSHVLIG